MAPIQCLLLASQDASIIGKPWSDGDKTIRKHAGAGFPGKPLWGGAASTWIKFVVPKNAIKPEALPNNEAKEEIHAEIKPAKPATPPAPVKAVLNPTRWPVQIVYAMLGSGDRNADVTLRLKELVVFRLVP